MAAMEIGSEVNECQENKKGRALRKRPSKPPMVSKRRKNESVQTLSEEICVEDLYRQDITKIANFQPSSLETIYESPRGKTSYLKDVMGIVKLKRHCRFSAFYDPPKLKVKQRKNKAKSLKRIGIKSLSTKVSLEQVEQALKEISGDEDEENKSSVFNSKLYAKDWCYQGNIIKPDNSFQAVTDLTSTLAGMDMSSWNFKEEFDRNNSDNFVLEHIDLKNNFNAYDNSKEMDLLIPSPTVIKSKKDRRRSGRVPPRVLEESTLETFSPAYCKATGNETSIVEGIHDPMESDFYVSSIKAVITDSTSKIDKSCSHQQSCTEERSFIKNDLLGKEIYSSCKKSNNQDLKTSDKNLRTLKKSAKKTKKTMRRTSGVRRPLYHSILNYSSESENTSPSTTIDVSSEIGLSTHRSEPVNKTSNTSSPTCLFDSLKISSPGSMTFNGNKVNKSKRRSARLSTSGLHMGSLWTDSKKNETDTFSIKEPFDDINLPIIRRQNYFASDSNYSRSTQISSLNSNSDLKSILVQKISEAESPINSVASDGFNETAPLNLFEHSPVVSGMFDSKARIFNGKKFVIEESQYSFNLNSFKPAQL